MSSEVGYRDLSTLLQLSEVSRSNINKLPQLTNSTSNGASSRNGSGQVSRTNSGHSGDEVTGQPVPTRRPSFGLNFLSSFTNSIRSHPQNSSQASESPNASPSRQSTIQQASSNARRYTEPPGQSSSEGFMANSPTIANFGQYNLSNDDTGNSGDITESNDMDVTMVQARDSQRNSIGSIPEAVDEEDGDLALEPETAIEPETSPEPATATQPAATEPAVTAESSNNGSGKDKDGFYLIRLTPLIDHSNSNSGLYFAPVIRKAKTNQVIRIGRYTEKNKAAAHAPQGLDAPIVFKSKVVSRTHAMFQCNEEGQWFVKDCKSSSGTFLNHIRLSPASQESLLMPLIDGDILQLGMDYRGGTEEVYRCVKMRCEFNKSWQRKVNQFNIEIHQKFKNLSLQQQPDPVANALNHDELSECAICLLKLEPCQALFISPCSHLWHYKCIRPIIIKSYPQFYCPNCRSMCDLETDIEDDD